MEHIVTVTIKINNFSPIMENKKVNVTFNINVTGLREDIYYSIIDISLLKTVSVPLSLGHTNSKFSMASMIVCFETKTIGTVARVARVMFCIVLAYV